MGTMRCLPIQQELPMVAATRMASHVHVAVTSHARSPHQKRRQHERNRKMNVLSILSGRIPVSGNLESSLIHCSYRYTLYFFGLFFIIYLYISSFIARVSYDIEHLMYYSKSPHAWALPTDWVKMVETVPSILRNKVIPASVDEHFIASPSCAADLTLAHSQSSVTTITSKSTAPPGGLQVVAAPFYNPQNNACNRGSINQTVTNNKQQQQQSQAQSNIITVTLDSSTAERKIISYERERNDLSNRKPSSESDRKLYNKQIQIITNTMEASASQFQSQLSQSQSSSSHSLVPSHSQSSLKTVFQRYSDNDEFSLAMCDAFSNEELNNNRALI